MIHFNSSVSSPLYLSHLQELNADYSNYRNKIFSQRSLSILANRYPKSDLFLCSSATDALEMVALMLNIQVGDEIIMPSFTFVSTANAFVSHGATPVFIDVDPETGSIDASLLVQALSEKTKAVVLMHYLGICPNISQFQSFCQEHQLYLIEDAAMGFGNEIDGRSLGSIGDFGVVSFDITKQLSAVQGGLLLVNNKSFQQRAKQIYHIGTNRDAFEQGEKPYYEWVDVGSKFQMNELNAAFLYDQLTQQDELLSTRTKMIRLYYDQLVQLEEEGFLRILLSTHMNEAVHGFVIVLPSPQIRFTLMSFLKENQIEAMFHYIPLHSSEMGRKCGRFIGGNRTDELATTILRLPVHLNLTHAQVLRVCEVIHSFFKKAVDDETSGE